MRIRILSDLHQEFGEADVPEVACDCVVLAGDVSTKLDGVRWSNVTTADKSRRPKPRPSPILLGPSS
jgi:hypothetical protein